ncbi:MAG: DEAD/DEAH box helicase [Treponema sp.]|nr:DEAD/DEAH box helicase [Treponema sp.]
MNTNDDFLSLGVCDSLTEKLKELGITTPTGIQKQVIPAALEGNNIIYQSETGTGKTFAYLLPLIQKTAENSGSGVKIIILAPTYELASQIKTACQSVTELKSSLFIGGTPIKRQIEAIKEKPQIVIGNPSRILELIHLKKLKVNEVESAVLDEADRLISVEIKDQTIDFINELPPDVQFMAASATVNSNTKRLLTRLMGGAKEILLPPEDILAKKITHYALFAESRDKIKTLKSLILAIKPEKALIFTSRADQVQNIWSKLNYSGVECLALHAKSDKKDRKAAIDKFRNGKCRLLVTSDLASRGLDIPGITHIIQMDLPSNEDFFVHRAGRTARAGNTGFNIVIGDEYEMRKYAQLEKKHGLTVYPKMLFKGQLVSPIDNTEEN